MMYLNFAPDFTAKRYWCGAMGAWCFLLARSGAQVGASAASKSPTARREETGGPFAGIRLSGALPAEAYLMVAAATAACAGGSAGLPLMALHRLLERFLVTAAKQPHPRSAIDAVAVVDAH